MTPLPPHLATPPPPRSPPDPCETHLVAGQQLARPVCLGHVVDGQAQVVVAVFEEQRVGLVDQAAAKLPLHLHHLLQGAENRELRYCGGLSGWWRRLGKSPQNGPNATFACSYPCLVFQPANSRCTFWQSITEIKHVRLDLSRSSCISEALRISQENLSWRGPRQTQGELDSERSQSWNGTHNLCMIAYRYCKPIILRDMI